MFIKIVIEQYINHITPLPFSLRADPSVAWTANWNRPNWITAEFSLLYRWHSLMPDSIDWPGGAIPIAAFQVDNRPLLSVGLDAAFSAAATQPAGELGAFNTADALLDIDNPGGEAGAVQPLGHLQPLSPGHSAWRRRKHLPKSVEITMSSHCWMQLYGDPDNLEFYPGLFAEDRVPDLPLPGLLIRVWWAVSILQSGADQSAAVRACV